MDYRESKEEFKRNTFFWLLQQFFWLIVLFLAGYGVGSISNWFFE